MKLNKRVFSGALAFAILAGNFVGVIDSTNKSYAAEDKGYFQKYEGTIKDIAKAPDAYLDALGFEIIEAAGLNNDVVRKIDGGRAFFEHPIYSELEQLKSDGKLPADLTIDKNDKNDPFYGVWYYPSSSSRNVVAESNYWYAADYRTSAGSFKGETATVGSTGAYPIRGLFDRKESPLIVYSKTKPADKTVSGASFSNYEKIKDPIISDINTEQSREQLTKLPDKGYFYIETQEFLDYFNDNAFSDLMEKYGFEYRADSGTPKIGTRVVFRNTGVTNWNYDAPANSQKIANGGSKKSVAFDEANKDNKELVATASKPVIYTAKDNVTVGMKNENGDQLSKQQLVNLPDKYKDEVKDYFWIDEPDTSKALVADASKEAKLGLRFDDGSVSEVPVKYTVKELPSVMTAEALNKKNTDARSRYARVDYVLKGADFTKNDNVKAPDVKVEGKVFDLSDWFSK